MIRTRSIRFRKGTRHDDTAHPKTKAKRELGLPSGHGLRGRGMHRAREVLSRESQSKRETRSYFFFAFFAVFFAFFAVFFAFFAAMVFFPFSTFADVFCFSFVT
jgi:hypothetical protein